MYEIGFRRATLVLYAYFKSMRKVGKMLNVSIASICRWNKCMDFKKRVRKSPKTSDALKSFIFALLSEKPFLSCIDISKMISIEFGYKVSRQLIHLIIKKSNWTYKRIRTRGNSVKKQFLTNLFIANYKTIPVDAKIVSIDESGFDQRAHPIYGYSPKGKQAILTHSYSPDRNRISLILGISNIGEKHFTLVTGSVNSQIFQDFVNSLTFPRGTYFMMDNCSIHRTNAFRQVMENKGYHILYTPPYSPEFNPIELVFGVIKNRYYKNRLIGGKYKNNR